MLEMSHSGKYHSDAMAIAGINGQLIPDRPARLNDNGDTGLSCRLHAIIKGEEGI
jgi:hypothetical protein